MIPFKKTTAMKRILFTVLIMVAFSNLSFAQGYLSSEGPIPVPSVVKFQKLSISDTASTDIIIVSTRRLKEKGQELTLSDNRGTKNTPIYMVVRLSEAQVVADTTKSINLALDRLKQGRHTLFFVHGYGKSFCDVVGMANRLRNRYHINVILFDWPSKCSNFNSALINVRRTTKYMEQTISDLRAYKEGTLVRTTTLMMHSLGNYYYARLIINNPAYSNFTKQPTFASVIFNAAAIKQKRHEALFNGYLSDENTFVIQNKDDKVLKGAGLLMWSPLLGRFSNSYSSSARYIDFTKIAEKHHTLFLGDTRIEEEHPFFKQFYMLLFNAKVSNLNDFPFLREKIKGLEFEAVD